MTDETEGIPEHLREDPEFMTLWRAREAAVEAASDAARRMTFAEAIKHQEGLMRQTRITATEAQLKLRRLNERLDLVPNKPKTPLHSFRVDDELWEAAKRRAEERGETLADALRKFLRRYTK